MYISEAITALVKHLALYGDHALEIETIQDDIAYFLSRRNDNKNEGKGTSNSICDMYIPLRKDCHISHPASAYKMGTNAARFPDPATNVNPFRQGTDDYNDWKAGYNSV